MSGRAGFIVVLIAGSVVAASPQTEEQEEYMEWHGWRWRTTGRLLSAGEVDAWRSRIANLDLDDTDECRNTRTGVLGVYQGGHQMGWATHVHAWAGVTVTGHHLAVGPFLDDHWIVIRPEGNGRSRNDVVTSMIHEAIHHLRDGGHRGSFSALMDCFTIDSGW